MPKKSRPAEVFGVFAIHRDGSVTTSDGRRPADLLAESLRATRQTLDEDMATIGAFLKDYENAMWRAKVYAERGPEFRPVPLAMTLDLFFRVKGAAVA
jgi:hypothetical protein